MKYAVIYKESYYVAPYDKHDTGGTSYYDTLQEFDDKAALLKWVELEESRFAKRTYRVIEFNELKVTKTVHIDLD